MNERRRALLRTAGVALVPAVAGCAEQSTGSTDTTTDEGSSTPTSTATSTASATETQSDTPTPTETETASPTETATPTETAASSASVTLVIDNVGARAWEVVEDESGSVAPTNESNPTLSLEVGQRYAVENGGWSAHPFAIRNADDTPLLSQSADGQFESDDTVDWTDDGQTFAFTYTEELAAEADYYICTIHSGMRGDIETV